MSAGHTPLPLRVVDREVMEDGSIYPMHILGGSNEFQVCLMEPQSTAALIISNPDKNQFLDQTTKANAAFIVRACNRDHLFDEMVKALKRASEDFEDTKLLLEQGLAKRELIIRSVETKEKAVRALLAQVPTC